MWVGDLSDWAGVLGFGGEASSTTEAEDMDPSHPQEYLTRFLEAVATRYGDAPLERSLAEFESFLLDHQERKKSTVDQRMRDLRRIANHPRRPVDLHAPPAEFVRQVIDFLAYRRDVEGKAATARVNDIRALRPWAVFNGLDPKLLPVQPHVPRRARERLATPEEVYALLHHPYTPEPDRNPENLLVRGMLTYCMSGWRFPSEAWSAVKDDLDPEWHLLTVHEMKKAGTIRRILVEPTQLCCRPNRMSMANWSKARGRVDRGLSDALFVKPDGTPFPSKEAMRSWLLRRVQPVFPWFQGYTLRRWIANALLVEWDFDYARVAEQLGHESVDMTRRTYEHEARLHARMYGKDWLARALARPRRKTAPQHAPGVPASYCATPSYEVDAPAGI